MNVRVESSGDRVLVTYEFPDRIQYDFLTIRSAWFLHRSLHTAIANAQAHDRYQKAISKDKYLTKK